MLIFNLLTTFEGPWDDVIATQVLQNSLSINVLLFITPAKPRGAHELALAQEMGSWQMLAKLR